MQKVLPTDPNSIKADNLKRILWIDQLRAIGILIVIMGHVALGKDAIKYIYSFHMPLFFAISGLTHRTGKYRDFKQFLKDKALKLLLPYLLLNIIMIPLWILDFKILSFSDVSIPKLLFGILYSNSDKYTAPSNATWFLTTLFLVQVLFYFCEKFANGDIKRLTLLTLIIGLAGYVESINPSNYAGIWHIQVVPTAFVFYSLGYAFMQYLPRFERLIAKKRHHLIYFVLAAIVGYYFCIRNKRVSFSGNNYGSILYFYLSAISTSVAVLLLIIKMPKIGFLSYIGKNTILYLGIHIPVIRLFEKLYPGVMSQPVYAALFAVVLFFALIPLCMLINKYLPFIAGRKYPKRTSPAEIP